MEGRRGSMNIGGISLILILGIINLILLFFQLSTGLRWMKVRFGIHRKTGIALLISAVLHALLALLASS